MSVDRSGRRAARFAKFVVDVNWWVGLALAVVLAAVFVAAPALERWGVVAKFDGLGFEVDNGSGPPVTVVPVSVPGDGSQLRSPVMSSDTGRVTTLTLERDVRHTLDLTTRRWPFFYLANALTLLGVVTGLIVLYLLRSFLAAVLDGQVFTPRNARRLVGVGWLLIVASLATGPLQHWRARLILAELRPAGVELSAAKMDGNGFWLVGVVVLVLAAAWRYGAELQTESDLTV